MLQNKIYQNFTKEVLKTFFVILIGLTLIAWTVRAVNFLDLIVESGYSISTYFQYSFLNLFGILTKFIPLAFLLSLIIFIVKQIQEKEFIILWTSGVKKMKIVNLFFLISTFILIFYLFFSTLITPLALNKSRALISQNNFNSFLPTIRVQQFSDSFKGFTFIVEKKIKNDIENVFIHDSSNTLKNLTSDQADKTTTTIVAKNGIVEEKKMILFDGQVISFKKNKNKNEIVKFKQLNIDLKDLQTGTIKQPKLQETSTLELLNCINNLRKISNLNCKENTKKEITTVLNRRIVLPFYIPIISLLCCFLLVKPSTQNNYFLNKYSIFILSFLVLLYAELVIRYTGISKIIDILFTISPVIFIPIIYIILSLKLSRESIHNE
ncbi:LptF/LptG family permease [Pelagibacteraceae bacterium]|nr:LptF/LptG family permease [Pelagibacteraceae bacterium]